MGEKTRKDAQAGDAVFHLPYYFYIMQVYKCISVLWLAGVAYFTSFISIDIVDWCFIVGLALPMLLLVFCLSPSGS